MCWYEKIALKFGKAIVWKIKCIVNEWRITSPTTKMLLKNSLDNQYSRTPHKNYNSVFGHQQHIAQQVQACLTQFKRIQH